MAKKLDKKNCFSLDNLFIIGIQAMRKAAMILAFSTGQWTSA